MTAPEAFCHTGVYPASPPQLFRVPQHYLLYAARGTMRLEADGRSWMLPPARAALIAADHPVTVTLTRPLEARSALFSAVRYAAPAAGLAVFDVSPLARELLAACAPWTETAPDRPNRATALFDALHAVAWDLAAAPSPTYLPVPKSPQLSRAIALTAERLDDPPGFGAIATTIGVSERTLARRFNRELGLSWRDLLRRMRLIRAAELLAETDDTVAQVGFAVGYNALSGFNAAFAELFGCSPSAYRRGCHGQGSSG